MGLKSFVKNTVKSNTNVKGWIDWGVIKSNARVIGNYYRDIKTANQETTTTSPTTFEEAIKQYGLSEADLNKQMKTHFAVALFSVILAIVALGWTGFLLSKGMMLSSLVSLSLAALMAAYAFREHFLFFKIKQRRLDCTVNEWFSSFTHSNRRSS